MKTKILADFQICLGVPLKITKIKWNQEKFWSFDKARNVLIEKRHKGGIKKTLGGHSIKANQICQRTAKLFMAKHLVKGPHER